MIIQFDQLAVILTDGQLLCKVLALELCIFNLSLVPRQQQQQDALLLYLLQNYLD